MSVVGHIFGPRWFVDEGSRNTLSVLEWACQIGDVGRHPAVLCEIDFPVFNFHGWYLLSVSFSSELAAS